MTSGLAALLSLAGIEFGFEESRKWVKAYLLFDVSENTIRSETEGLGALQVQREKALSQQCQTENHIYKLVCEKTDCGRNACMVRWMQPRCGSNPRLKDGKKPKKEENWRDLKVGCWYEAEPVPCAQRSRRHRHKQARGQTALRARKMRYFCDIQNRRSSANSCGLPAVPT